MRSKKAPKRILAKDPIYGSKLVSKLINKIMYDGKKSTAANLVYRAFENIKEGAKQDPMIVFEKAIANIAPKMEVRARRVGGASYQVPVEVKGERKETLAIRWLIEAARSKSNKEFHTFDQKLAAEILAASNNDGGALKKKSDVEKTATATRAFAHFRW